MAIHVLTQKSDELLRVLVSNCRNGTITTWAVDEDEDFTHTEQQWKYRAWFRPSVSDEELIFNIVGPTGVEMSSKVYAIYHGRFVEMLLEYFDDSFEQVSATAMPDEQDMV